MSAPRVLSTSLLLSFLPLISGTILTGCSSHPGLVFRLPASTAGSNGTKSTDAGDLRSVLPGTWIRLVESRYSVVNPEIYWKGREWIEISLQGDGDRPAFAYEKTHLYAEYYRGELRRVAYREAGVLRVQAPWLLFEPGKARVLREKRAVSPEEKKAFDSSRRILLPDLDAPDAGGDVKDASPRALRFYYNRESKGTAEQGTLRNLNFLTPLTYERFGTVFEHGIYEGCLQACDPQSRVFRAALRRYNVNSFHRHGYEKKAAAPGPVY